MANLLHRLLRGRHAPEETEVPTNEPRAPEAPAERSAPLDLHAGVGEPREGDA